MSYITLYCHHVKDCIIEIDIKDLNRDILYRSGIYIYRHKEIEKSEHN